MNAAEILDDVRLVLNAAVLVGSTVAETVSWFQKARNIANGTQVLDDAERAQLRQQQADLEAQILAANPDA